MNKLNLWHDLWGFPLLDWPFAQMPVQQQDNYTGSIPVLIFCYIDCTTQDTLSLTNTTTKFNWGKQARVNNWLQHLCSIQAIGSGILKVIEQQIQKCKVCFTWWYHKTTEALNLLLGVTSWGFTTGYVEITGGKRRAHLFSKKTFLFVNPLLTARNTLGMHTYILDIWYIMLNSKLTSSRYQVGNALKTVNTLFNFFGNHLRFTKAHGSTCIIHRTMARYQICAVM